MIGSLAFAACFADEGQQSKGRQLCRGGRAPVEAEEALVNILHRICLCASLLDAL